LIPALAPIQALTQRCGIKPVVFDLFAPSIPVPGVYHVVLDAKFLELAVQVKREDTRFMTGHHLTGALPLSHHKEHQLVLGHLVRTGCGVAPSA
jgi:hypothetical protein